jgi:hypothetical protein
MKGLDAPTFTRSATTIGIISPIIIDSSKRSKTLMMMNHTTQEAMNIHRILVLQDIHLTRGTFLGA